MIQDIGMKETVKDGIIWLYYYNYQHEKSLKQRKMVKQTMVISDWLVKTTVISDHR